ncbi:MAG: hypothetical protein M3Q29_14185 [Chloroflexota bacterium]|nr:hypothetical protein [Chloroflexota bacterium]
MAGVRNADTLEARRAQSLPQLSQLGLLVVGLFVFALGIVLTLRSRMGLGPWDVLHEGLSLRSPLSFGQAAILIGALIILLNVLLGERPGVGTLANMVLIGLVTDLILWTRAVPDLTGFPIFARLIMDVTGVAFVGMGSALYIKAGLGAGPRDGLMLALTRRSGWRVGPVRTGIELCALLLGWLLGGTVGVGTAVFAFGIGPAVEVAFRLFRVRPHR